MNVNFLFLYMKIERKAVFEVIPLRKFVIPRKPPTTSKTIRFPNDMIDGIELHIRGKECTFTAFVVEAVRIALENLKEE